MNQSPKEELVVRGPILVPFGWLIALFGTCGTAISLAIAGAMAWSAVSTKVDANAATLASLQNWKKEKESESVVMQLKVQRIENMLEFQFPSAARAVPDRTK